LNQLAGLIRLDFRSDEPIFLQISRQVQALVAEGTLKPGDQLPTVRELAIDLRINFSTVARAYRILDEQRLISTQRGRGTYIWDEDPPIGQKDKSQIFMSDEHLAHLVQKFMGEAFDKGATPEQIAQIFQQELEKRKRNHTSGG